jgi:transcriptional regulator with XRE-family HTH domain
MSLGERLLELRKSKHLSQEELAYKLDVTRQTISKWETDQSTPDFDKIMPLCELYGITSDELLTGLKKEEEVKESNSNEVSNKSKRLGLVISIFLFFLAIAWVVLADEFSVPDGINVPIFLLIIAFGVCILVYNYAGSSKKKEEKIEVVDVSQKVFDAIKGAIAIIVLIIYLGISFLTGAWHITWIVWPMYAVIVKIVELCFLLKGKDVKDE